MGDARQGFSLPFAWRFLERVRGRRTKFCEPVLRPHWEGKENTVVPLILLSSRGLGGKPLRGAEPYRDAASTPRRKITPSITWRIAAWLSVPVGVQGLILAGFRGGWSGWWGVDGCEQWRSFLGVWRGLWRGGGLRAEIRRNAVFDSPRKFGVVGLGVDDWNG